MSKDKAPSDKTDTGHEHSEHSPEHQAHEPDHGAGHAPVHSQHDHGTEHHPHHKRQKQGETVLTVRAISGLSGDMMLSGLAGLSGLHDEELNNLVKELKLPALDGCLKVAPRSVHQIAGLGCTISLPHEHTHRSLRDIATIIADSDMPEEVRRLSLRAFTILADAEAAVHGKTREEVAFHEVGALDSILDICLVCRLFVQLNPSRFVCSPLPLADGTIFCAHGAIPSPAPAVLRMLEGVAVCGFRACGETVTPTALALLKALNAAFGIWPDMTIATTVISYGDKIFENAPNGAVWALGKATTQD